MNLIIPIQVNKMEKLVIQASDMEKSIPRNQNRACDQLVSTITRILANFTKKDNNNNNDRFMLRRQTLDSILMYVGFIYELYRIHYIDPKYIVHTRDLVEWVEFSKFGIILADIIRPENHTGYKCEFCGCKYNEDYLYCSEVCEKNDIELKIKQNNTKYHC